MVDRVLFSSKLTEWNTPIKLYEELNNIYHFDTDPCTQKDNPLNCKYFYTKETDGLKQDWIGNVFINPPYGLIVNKWVHKASVEYWKNPYRFIVMLLPARTDTRWFHKYLYDVDNMQPYKFIDIKFLKGRIRFESSSTHNFKYSSFLYYVTKDSPATFPSMIVIFKKQDKPK